MICNDEYRLRCLIYMILIASHLAALAMRNADFQHFLTLNTTFYVVCIGLENIAYWLIQIWVWVWEKEEVAR